MMEPKETEDSNVLPTIENEKRYELHFNEEIAGRIQVFCESFRIEVIHFIVKTVESRLYTIARDIENNEYDFVLQYFALSKLDGSHSVENVQEDNNKNVIVGAIFPPLTSMVIENIRRIIPWALGKFLEDIITESTDELFDKINNGEYDFLDTYLDFSVIKELIHQLEREGLKKDFPMKKK